MSAGMWWGMHVLPATRCMPVCDGAGMCSQPPGVCLCVMVPCACLCYGVTWNVLVDAAVGCAVLKSVTPHSTPRHALSLNP